MNYGFVIDNRACIGCHACSTACKSENDVPLGVYRTWVKYVETGAGADSRRHFQVTRCNHCANPPCVRICPVTAMYQRQDGIVEFDSAVCIGCKACLQACPYDAIHIDPSSGTAAKCHYCSHRTDLGLEPACVVVCPTHAIIAGDMDDPRSEIARMLSREKFTVRRPEQGTSPKLFYIDGTDLAMHPTASDLQPRTFLFADVLEHDAHAHPSRVPRVTPASPAIARSGALLRAVQSQGLPAGGALSISGSIAGQLVQTSYNAQHRIPWHWPVPAYLVTKAVGSGLFALLAFGLLSGMLPFDRSFNLLATTVSLGFIGLTTVLLVLDLERPERFLSIIFRPQWKSWLARGAFLLIGFTAVAGGWGILEWAVARGWLEPSIANGIQPLALGLGFALALGCAVYTAFLFGQAEGRDLWQSPLLPLHMAIQAAMAGAAAMVALALAAPATHPELYAFARGALGLFLVLDLTALLMGELAMPHASETAARAAHEIRHGRWRHRFWLGAVVLGHLLPLLLLALRDPVPAGVACACAIAGLYLFEEAFVSAPQTVPNS